MGIYQNATLEMNGKDDILRFHTILGLPDSVIQTTQLHEEDTLPTYKRGISRLADSVLDVIAQTGREDGTDTSKPAIRTPHSRFKKASQRQMRWLVGLVAASICVIVLGIMCFPSISQDIFMSIHGSPKQAAAAASIWSDYQEQTSMIRQGQNVFAVEYGTIMDNRDFGFFYVYRSSHARELPQVKVVSTLPSQSKTSIIINSTVQKIGMVGDFEIGEISAHIQDRVGQVIVVQGMFPEQGTSWHLSICRQNFPLRPSDPSVTAGTYGGGAIIYQNVFPEITVNIPQPTPVYENLTSNTYGYTHPVGLISFTSSSPQKKSTTPASIDMRLDYLWKQAMVKATIISQATYQKLEGPQPTYSGPRNTLSPSQFDATATATAKK